ncbi:large ribosomal subunit protein bL32m-like [Tubulanus polymorphus]|uniref:large ribosomal subunit protein bL32m-like n=1 Tax=Tubulanus polymorphus TaxID=672921 RepID=UPI003DA62794
MISRLGDYFLRLEAKIVNYISLFPHPGYGAAFAINSPAGALPQSDGASNSGQSLLESILGNGIFYAVPKHRRTVERRSARKHAWGGGRMEDHQPKKHIVACLDCGNYHEKHTICGHCYEKVKKETQAMQEALGVDTLKFQAPTSELKFLYKDENKDNIARHQEKFIVEMEKKRPEWFPQVLLTKPNKS